MLPGGTFTIAGWAATIDGRPARRRRGPWWAYPVAGGSPVFVGAAALGGYRADIGTIFGPGYETSGFTLDVTSLPSGTWDLAVFARSTGSALFGAVRVVRVTVP